MELTRWAARRRRRERKRSSPLTRRECGELGLRQTSPSTSFPTVLRGCNRLHRFASPSLTLVYRQWVQLVATGARLYGVTPLPDQQAGGRGLGSSYGTLRFHAAS